MCDNVLSQSTQRRYAYSERSSSKLDALKCNTEMATDGHIRSKLLHINKALGRNPRAEPSFKERQLPNADHGVVHDLDSSGGKVIKITFSICYPDKERLSHRVGDNYGHKN